MARGVSTVLDVSVCLLLVGAAVATLALAPHSADRPAGPDGDAAASTVAKVTTTVPAGGGRRAHDTLAGHLATAAVANARLDGDRLTETTYPAAVADETDALTHDRTYVTARWAPYSDGPLGGTVAAGTRPPPNADVAARALTVDSGVAAPDEVRTFEGLARAIADAYVAWLFPPERTYASLADPRTSDRTTARYRAASATVGADVHGPVADGAVRVANERLSATLARRIEGALREQYATPEAAAEDVTVDEVDLVVRRWEP